MGGVSDTSSVSARTNRVRWHQRHDQLAIIGLVAPVVAGAAFVLWPRNFVVVAFYLGAAALCAALIWFITDLVPWPAHLAGIRKAIAPVGTIVVTLALGSLASQSMLRPTVDVQVVRIERIAIGWRREGAGMRLYAAVHYANAAAFAVTIAGTGGTFFGKIDTGHKDRIDRPRSFAVDAAAAEPHMIANLGPNERRIFKISGPLLKKAEYTHFRSGRYRFYVAGQIRATDGHSVSGEDFCRFSEGDPGVIFTCNEHNRGS
jgi:hypothetical protein